MPASPRVLLGAAVPSAVLAVAAACAPARDAAGRPVVAVSVPPQAYFVERIAGDLVDVVVMVPPGANPATHEPSVRQMQAISRAALYVAVGHPAFPFERAWLGRFLRENPRITVVTGTQGEDRADDPHVWLAPSAVRPMVIAIAKALGTVEPAHRATFQANLAELLSAIDSLDGDIRATLAPLPSKRFAVFHPAWGHYARDYGLEQIAIEVDGKEPSAAQLATVIDRLRREGVRIVFVQPQFSKASAEVIASEIGGTVRSIDPLAYDWLGNMRAVTRALAEALTP